MTENGLMDGTRTEKLFYNDSHLSKFTAMVLECEPYEKKEGCYAVELERTAFFPEGGGQYADTGILGGVHVLDAQRMEEFCILQISRLKQERLLKARSTGRPDL